MLKCEQKLLILSFWEEITEVPAGWYMAVVNQLMKREFSNVVSMYKIPGTAVQCNGVISQIRFGSNSRYDLSMNKVFYLWPSE